MTADHPEVSAATQGVLYFLAAFFVTVVIVGVTHALRSLLNRLQMPSVSRSQPPPPVSSKEMGTGTDPTPSQQQPGVSLKQLMKNSKAKKGAAGVVADSGTHHSLFLNALKGHQDAVNGLAWSPDGSALATACEDRVVRIFKDPLERNVNARKMNLQRGPVDVAFGDTTQEVVVLMKGSLDSASIAMYGGTEVLWERENVHGGRPGMSIASAPASRGGHGIIMACDYKTEMRVFSTKGKEMAAVDTNGLENHDAVLSADGRFVAAATFTSDVRIHENMFKGGEYLGTCKVMDLKGHKSQVLCLDFSPDSKRAVTASKDGTWCIWNIDVRYKMDEDPKRLLQSPQPLPKGRYFERISFGPGGIVAASCGPALFLLDSSSGEILDEVEQAHDSHVSSMAWSPCKLALPGGEKVAVLATGSSDRKVRLWRPPRMADS